MTRKEKHRLLAKLAGIPWQFTCPSCGGSYFGSSMQKDGIKVMKRYCRDQYRGRCNWSGTDEECSLTPDYDKDHNAWVAIRLALDGKCVWRDFMDAWSFRPGGRRSDSDWMYAFLNDLPGQVDAAIQVMASPWAR